MTVSMAMSPSMAGASMAMSAAMTTTTVATTSVTTASVAAAMTAAYLNHERYARDSVGASNTHGIGESRRGAETDCRGGEGCDRGRCDKEFLHRCSPLDSRPRAHRWMPTRGRLLRLFDARKEGGRRAMTCLDLQATTEINIANVSPCGLVPSTSRASVTAAKYPISNSTERATLVFEICRSTLLAPEI